MGTEPIQQTGAANAGGKGKTVKVTPQKTKINSVQVEAKKKAVRKEFIQGVPNVINGQVYDTIHLQEYNDRTAYEKALEDYAKLTHRVEQMYSQGQMPTDEDMQLYMRPPVYRPIINDTVRVDTMEMVYDTIYPQHIADKAEFERADSVYNAALARIEQMRSEGKKPSKEDMEISVRPPVYSPVMIYESEPKPQGFQRHEWGKDDWKPNKW